MLTIAPDLIEAMLEILQKTRWLQTALSVIELQQMIIQAIYLRVRFQPPSCHSMKRRPP